MSLPCLWPPWSSGCFSHTSLACTSGTVHVSSSFLQGSSSRALHIVCADASHGSPSRPSTLKQPLCPKAQLLLSPYITDSLDALSHPLEWADFFYLVHCSGTSGGQCLAQSRCIVNRVLMIRTKFCALHMLVMARLSSSFAHICFSLGMHQLPPPLPLAP